jgi:hypothetical protein
MSGGGGGGGQNTVSTSQQIPQFEQDFAQQNQQLAASIGSQPYPTYDSQLIQGQDPWQNVGQWTALDAANSYKPGLDQAQNATVSAMDPTNVNAYTIGAANAAGNASDPSLVNAYTGASANRVGQALGTSPTNGADVQAYMSPFIQQALAPQIQDLQLQQAQQQQAIASHATQANAFGDARQGAAEALQNLYGNQAMNQLIGTGYSNAYDAAMKSMAQQQGIGLQGAQQLGQLGNLQLQEQGVGLNHAQQLAQLGNMQLQEQGVGLQGANQLGNMAGLNQQLGITGANAVYNVGQQNQQLGQSQLNAAYQQYLNQVNWPTQMLNIRESALSNSPYNVQSAVTLPNGNSTAQGFGALTGASGLIGSLLSGSGGGGSAPFGGQKMA